MRRLTSGFLTTLLTGLLIGLAVAHPVAQGTLSNQVLQLLSRVNSWIGTNTFYDFRLPSGPCLAVPSATAGRIYTDASCNLYWNGSVIGASGGGVGNHNLLSSVHPDTLAAAVTRASIIIGNATPAWAEVTPSVTGSVLQYNGTDTVFSTSGANLTNLPAANLTGGPIPAMSGVNLTNLNASNLASGTVPLAQLSGITNAQIAGGAAIAYSKLALAASVNLASDMTGVLPLANGGTGLSTAANHTVLLSTGAAWTATTVPDCPTNALSFTQATNLFSCSTISGGGGVTSVALAAPGILTVSGSPITSSGTITLGLATQSANLVWAGPGTGAAANPTFRALVNADFPASGVVAGTYPKVTVNAQGLITAGTAQASLTADVSGVLPLANGGTGQSAAANHTTLVSNGTVWTVATVPDCQLGALAFTQSTNLYSCVVPAAINLAAGGGGGVTGILPGANGGTNNAFFQIAGPAASVKTFTLPNATANILTDNVAVTVPQGGTGIAAVSANAIIKGNGTGPMVVSTCTINASNAISCPGGVVAGGTGAGDIDLPAGTVPGSFPANTVSIYAPAAIATSYQWVLPAADAAGPLVSSGAGTPGVISIVAGITQTCAAGHPPTTITVTSGIVTAITCP